MEKPEALVIGGGVSGLLSAALLLKAGKSVQLVEKLPQAGGRFSPELRQGFVLGSTFSFGDASWWGAVADRLGIAANLLPVDQGGVLTFGSKGWVTPEELPAWEAHLARPNTEFPAHGLQGVIQALLQFCQNHSAFSLAVETPATGIEVEAGKVKLVRLGADAICEPGEVHFASDYKTLLEILQGPGVPEPGPERVSWLKKYRKTQSQPAVVLEFAHKGKASEFTETLLLPFSAGDKEERRYLVGSFVSNRDPQLAPQGFSLSSWIFPLSEMEWGDNHETMKKIRAGKRLVEKAFPNVEKNIFFERVLVLDSSFAPLTKKKGDREPVFANLFLAADWAMPTGATIEGVAEGLLR
jgi:phytoene dehydrogenase-like protein